MIRGAAVPVAIALALAGCTKKPADPVAEAKSEAAAQGRTPDLVECAIGDEKPAQCVREVSADSVGPVWTIRRSDGGFRRFTIIDGGRRIASADGADEVRATRGDGYLDVHVGNEAYRFADRDAAPR